MAGYEKRHMREILYDILIRLNLIQLPYSISGRVGEQNMSHAYMTFSHVHLHLHALRQAAWNISAISPHVFFYMHAFKEFSIMENLAVISTNRCYFYKVGEKQFTDAGMVIARHERIDTQQLIFHH